MAGKFGDPLTLTVGDRQVRCSNPQRPYFAEVGLSKLDVVNYYVAVADVLLCQLRSRPTTLERWPGGVVAGTEPGSGVKGAAFYQKRVPRGAPDYVQTCRITFPSGRNADEVCPTVPAVVVWAATLGTITFHPWPVRSDRPDNPDELRLDFDPQPGTDFRDAAEVALAARDLMAEWGWTSYVKTSGGRGVHVYVRIEPRWTFTEVRRAAIGIGRELERRLPGRVTTNWWKEERGERIFVDYNQNARDRTIAAAWSIRPRPQATVSTPLNWDELLDVVPEKFTVKTTPARLASVGDPWASVDDEAHDLTPALELFRRDQEQGLGDLPYPPDHPKMPGEPKRVQPSRATDPPGPVA